MEYTESIVMLLMWPVFILFTFLFVRLNLKHFHKLERLEELEKLVSEKDQSGSLNKLL